MIPFVLIGGGLYLLFDALGESKKTFDPADFGFPTKGFRGYRKGAAHFAKGGETGKVGVTYFIGKPEVDKTGRFGKKRAIWKTCVVNENGEKNFGEFSTNFIGDSSKIKLDGITISESEFNKLSFNKKMAKGGEVPKVGQRVELIEMYDDPQPIEPGTKGTIVHIGGDVINVNWDNGRRLGLVMDVDKFKVLD